MWYRFASSVTIGSSESANGETKQIASRPALRRLTGSEAASKPAVHPGVAIYDYVRLLPEIRNRAYETARPDWETGNTPTMIESTYAIIDVLEDVLASLATYYPPGHFEADNPRDYISELIATRFRWHRYRHEPDGRGKNGTIVGVLVAGSVLRDVERMIEEMVGALTLDWEGSGDFKFEDWKRAWKGAHHVDARGLRVGLSRRALSFLLSNQEHEPPK